MALPNDKISIPMVARELGTTENDLGRLCIHPNVNKWSKYKPVPNNEISFPNRDDNNANGRPNWQGVDTNKLLNTIPVISGIQSCGLWIPQLNQYTTWNNVKVAMDETIRNHNWNKSFTSEDFPNIPKRLGDFRSYEHSTDYAKEFWIWDNEVGNKALGTPIFNFGSLFSNVEGGWKGLDWSSIPAISKLNATLPFANCILFQGISTTIKTIFSTNVYSNGVPQFPLEATTNWNEGQYKCYFFFSNTKATTSSIPTKIIPLYNLPEANNPFTYTLKNQADLRFANFKYSYALGSQLLDYELFDKTQYNGPYGIHSNFNNSVSNTGFIIALDIINNSSSTVNMKGSGVEIHLNNYMTHVQVDSADVLGLYETNQASAINLLSTGLTIPGKAVKTVYFLIGVEFSNVANGDEFNILIEQFTILNNGVDLWDYSISGRYRASSARSFYNLSTGNDFTTI